MPKRYALALAAVLCATSGFGGQNAVDVDPEHHRVLFENEQIRVVRMVYPPGYKTPMHSHLPGVTVNLAATEVHSWDADGEESDTETTAGTASWSDGNAVHANQVTGEGPLELVRVEIKKPGTKPIPAPELDPLKVDPAHHELLLENDQVRVIRATYPPGYASPRHTHLPGLTISLTDRQWQATYDSGEKSSADPTPAGDVSDFGTGSEPHSTKNLGTSSGEAIRVELKTRM